MNKNLLIATIFALSTTLAGCAMLTSWKSIPPPGGCDQCHTVAISTNWQVTYKPVALNDERNTLSFQKGSSTVTDTRKPDSSLELRKEQETRCFECHKAPTPAHTGRTGRYHH